MENTRRDFLKATGGLMAATSIIGGVPFGIGAAGAEEASSADMDGGGKLAEHTLPPLPYAYDALEPYIDEETMRIHHDKHHAGYVKGLNEAEKQLADARAAGDYAYIQYWSRKAAFNGGGNFLHSMFWKVMGPPGDTGGGEPKGALADRISKDFGSFAAFKSQFSAASKAVEGSGWGLLHFRPSDGALLVLQGENQQKLSPWETIPILGVDVWEHAYYLKYKNDRGAYVDAWWNVVNWGQVAANYDAVSSAAKGFASVSA